MTHKRSTWAGLPLADEAIAKFDRKGLLNNGMSSSSSLVNVSSSDSRTARLHAALAISTNTAATNTHAQGELSTEFKPAGTSHVALWRSPIVPTSRHDAVTSARFEIHVAGQSADDLSSPLGKSQARSRLVDEVSAYDFADSPLTHRPPMETVAFDQLGPRNGAGCRRCVLCRVR